jgi:hypothetical protein
MRLLLFYKLFESPHGFMIQGSDFLRMTSEERIAKVENRDTEKCSGNISVQLVPNKK